MPEMPFPDDWDGVSTCRWAVCWPDSEKWKAILYGLIESPMQGRFWDFSTGQFIPTRELFRPIYDYNFNLRRCFVACNDGEFQQLIDAIEGISIALSASSGGDSCCNGGFGGRPAPPTTPGVEGDPPPDGFEQPTDEMGEPIFPGDPDYQSRKCKVANMIHFQTEAMVDKILASAFLTWTAETYGKLLTEFMLVALGYVLGELSTPWPFIDGVLGIVLAWQSNLLEKLLGETDMAALSAALAANEQELVCALYNATNAIDATNDYLQVLQDNGVSVGNQEVILAIFVPRLINVVFFKQAESEAMEDAIANYIGPVDCDLCGDCAGVLDTFTDTNGTLLENHVPEESCGPWGESAGNWIITGNRAGTTLTGVGSSIVIPSGLFDCEVQVTVNCNLNGENSSANQGLLVRNTTAGHYLCVFQGNPVNLLRIAKREAGNLVTVASKAASLSGDHVFKAVLNGPQIDFYVDGNLELTYSNTFNQTSEGHGLIAGQSTLTTFDTFMVDPLP